MSEAAKGNNVEQKSPSESNRSDIHQSCDDDDDSDDRRSIHAEENDAFLFFSYLEEVEDRIEHLRRHAIALSQEKESLLLVLSQLKEESMTGSLSKDEFQDICVSMDRLRTRCHAVNIEVKTIRSPEQEQAYLKVCTLVDELDQCCSLTDKKIDAFRRAKSYLNACSSDATENGAIDFKFQGMILDCVIDDQKKFRHRLEAIVRNNFQPTENSSRSRPFESDESCIKPSVIASAVKVNPHYDCAQVDNSSTELQDNHICAGNPVLAETTLEDSHQCGGLGNESSVSTAHYHSNGGANGSGIPLESTSTKSQRDVDS